jgi:hypothetical protein
MDEDAIIEIRLLWDVALNYYELIDNNIIDNSINLELPIKKVRESYKKSIPNSEINKHNLFIGHLSSLSIRLYTINQILKNDGNAISNYYFDLYKNTDKDTNQVYTELKKNYCDNIQDILKDDVSHVENDSGNNKNVFDARKRLLNELSINDIYCSLLKLKKKYTKKLGDFI